MKKTTQNVTQSIWRSGLLAFVFLFSLSINSQNVGDEYVINSGLNSNGTGDDLVWDMNANFSNTKPATSIGWTAYSSAGYNSSAATPSANNPGACHSENRMLKLFKKGGPDGQFVTQEIANLPSGNYNWSFWTKWATLVDYDVAGAAGDAKKPTFTIATDDDADGTWEVVQTVIPTEPSSAHTWVQDTGTYNNEIARKVRIKFFKYGGTNVAQTNLNQLMMIDDVSLNYAGPSVQSLVGQEYLVNPNINTTVTSPDTGVNGGGNMPANLGGWTGGVGGAYAPTSAGNGDCHSEDRMFKFNKNGGAAGMYVFQDVEDLPAGNFNWSFYTRWGAVVDYNAGDAKKPTFTILTDDDADGTWEVVKTIITTQPTVANTWVQQTGTFENDTPRDVRIKFYKNGGNLNQLMFIDDVSLNYASSLIFLEDNTSLSDLTIDGAIIAGFLPSKSTYDIVLGAGTTVVPTVAATTNNTSATTLITAATSIPGTTTILVTAEDGSTTNTVSINFSIPAPGVVGQEYLVNPNVNSATGANSTTPDTGVDGSGGFSGGHLGGWNDGANGAFAPTSAGNGDCHSEDRLFRFYDSNIAYVNQIIELPPGIYSWSFWTRWKGLVTWAAGADVKPKFTISTDDDVDGSWTAVETTIITQPTAVNSWVQQTGTYTNDIHRQVRIQFYKDGRTNLDQEMYIDDVSLKFVGSNAWTGTTDTDWDTAANWSNGVPGASSEVFIPGGLSTYPTASSAVAVTSLTMGPGASFIANSDFTGAVTYNRTLGTNNWYLVSSPVGGETYDNTYVTANQIALGADPDNRGIAPYIPSDDSWDYMESGETEFFGAGNGYSVKRTFGGDISFTGTLNTADVSAGALITAGNRFNLLGNPYTSHIASATFLTNEQPAISETQTLWVWNQATGVSGAYEVKTVADAMVLAPAQAFFVKANAAGGTFNFAESNQVSTGGTFQRTANRPEIYLSISNQTDAREAKIYFIDNMTSGFDVGYEGELFNGVSNPLAIYTHLVADSEGQNYQVQSLPTNNYENMIVPVGVNAASGSAITIEASTNNFPEGLKIFLEDKQHNSFTLLDADANFNTTLENDLNGIGRFYLHTNSKRS